MMLRADYPMLHPADPEGICYSALGFQPGFAPEAALSPYVKLLVMLAGVGSPGTIQEVHKAVMQVEQVKLQWFAFH